MRVNLTVTPRSKQEVEGEVHGFTCAKPLSSVLPNRGRSCFPADSPYDQKIRAFCSVFGRPGSRVRGRSKNDTAIVAAMKLVPFEPPRTTRESNNDAEGEVTAAPELVAAHRAPVDGVRKSWPPAVLAAVHLGDPNKHALTSQPAAYVARTRERGARVDDARSGEVEEVAKRSTSSSKLKANALPAPTAAQDESGQANQSNTHPNTGRSTSFDSDEHAGRLDEVSRKPKTPST